MDDIVKRIRQQSYFGLEPYEAANEIEQLRQRVQELEKERDELLAALELMLERISEPPEANCSCHLFPPCADCTDFGGEREAFAEALAAIASVKGGAA